MFRRSPLQPHQELLPGGQFPPDEAREKTDRNIRKTGLAERICRTIVRCQDQM